MNKTTKIVLWSVGGLALATGLFFGIKALIPKKDDDFDDRDKDDYQRLLEKERQGNLTNKEREELEKLRNETVQPGVDEIGGGKMCPSTFKNNSKGICVAKMQLAINEKHDNSWSGDGYWDGTIDYPCEGAGNDLAVDGVMGPNTLKAINKFYPSSGLCSKGGRFDAYCYCKGSINKSTYNRIIKGADTSNSALEDAGYDFKPGEEAWNAFSGYANAGGSRSGIMSVGQTTHPLDTGQCEGNCGMVNGEFHPACATCGTGCNCVCKEGNCTFKASDSILQDNRYSNFTLSNKEQLRGQGQMEWRTMQGVMGDFYPNSYGFIDKPVVQTNLEHTYGMRNFGGDVSINLPRLDLYARKL